MAEFKCEIADISQEYKTGKTRITLLADRSILNAFDDLLDKVLNCTLKLFRKKRSLDANAYFWVLCGKLATKTRQNKRDIYKQLIKEIGDNFEIVPIRNDAVETWCKNWESRGEGWQCDILGDSKHSGYTNICCYYGSSTYDTEQMSALIDSVVFDCKEQGIETMTPDQIAELKARWGENE